MSLIYMILAIFFIFVIGATVIAGTKVDSNYDQSTKGNFSRLSILYVVLTIIVIVIIVVGLFVFVI